MRKFTVIAQNNNKTKILKDISYGRMLKMQHVFKQLGIKHTVIEVRTEA